MTGGSEIKVQLPADWRPEDCLTICAAGEKQLKAEDDLVVIHVRHLRSPHRVEIARFPRSGRGVSKGEVKHV